MSWSKDSKPLLIRWAWSEGGGSAGSEAAKIAVVAVPISKASKAGSVLEMEPSKVENIPARVLVGRFFEKGRFGDMDEGDSEEQQGRSFDSLPASNFIANSQIK